MGRSGPKKQQPRSTKPAKDQLEGKKYELPDDLDKYWQDFLNTNFSSGKYNLSHPDTKAFDFLFKEAWRDAAHTELFNYLENDKNHNDRWGDFDDRHGHGWAPLNRICVAMGMGVANINIFSKHRGNFKVAIRRYMEEGEWWVEEDREQGLWAADGESAEDGEVEEGDD
ncbi:hypothetical protein EJ08DRAFT_697985 [Tothia fuscella]|uniref:Uncharacterized protein n=1 Tax=Tothia fuscella TaxID=1048955 RepID=A0A9P4NPK7_9PEZI|nr:hypothetical protein EJ08DRAFT_697985 [Tothia fuscella]